MSKSYSEIYNLLIEACKKLNELKYEYKYIPYPGYGYVTIEYTQLSRCSKKLNKFWSDHISNKELENEI